MPSHLSQKALGFLATVVTVLSGCSLNQKHFVEGTYYTFEIGKNERITNAKFILHRVTSRAFAEANNINVIEDHFSPESSKYFSINLYFQYNRKADLKSTNLLNLEYQNGTPQTYCGKINYDLDNKFFETSLLFIYSETCHFKWSEPVNGSSELIDLSFHLKME